MFSLFSPYLKHKEEAAQSLFVSSIHVFCPLAKASSSSFHRICNRLPLYSFPLVVSSSLVFLIGSATVMNNLFHLHTSHFRENNERGGHLAVRKDTTCKRNRAISFWWLYFSRYVKKKKRDEKEIAALNDH